MEANISGLSLSGTVPNPDMYSILNLDELINDNRGDISQFDICMGVLHRILMKLSKKQLIGKKLIISRSKK